MAKQNSNITYQWYFLEKHVEGCTCQWFKFFSQIYFHLYHKELLFYTGIYFLKHRVIIVTCKNYYATDSHFIKISILKPITVPKTQVPKLFGSKKVKQF